MKKLQVDLLHTGLVYKSGCRSWERSVATQEHSEDEEHAPWTKFCCTRCACVFVDLCVGRVRHVDFESLTDDPKVFSSAVLIQGTVASARSTRPTRH